MAYLGGRRGGGSTSTGSSLEQKKKKELLKILKHIPRLVISTNHVGI